MSRKPLSAQVAIGGKSGAEAARYSAKKLISVLNGIKQREVQFTSIV
jgi:hypothetical protein